MRLAVGVADRDVVMVDQRDSADARAHAGFGRPGTHAPDADDAEMRTREGFERGLAENPGEARKAFTIDSAGQRDSICERLVIRSILTEAW